MTIDSIFMNNHWPIRLLLGEISRAILTAAGLSFIGFGAQPPTPEWSAIVSDTRNFIGIAPWTSSFPAIAILITVLVFNLLGDGLRDVLDPRDYGCVMFWTLEIMVGKISLIN